MNKEKMPVGIQVSSWVIKIIMSLVVIHYLAVLCCHANSFYIIYKETAMLEQKVYKMYIDDQEALKNG